MYTDNPTTRQEVLDPSVVTLLAEIIKLAVDYGSKSILVLLGESPNKIVLYLSVHYAFLFLFKHPTNTEASKAFELGGAITNAPEF